MTDTEQQKRSIRSYVLRTGRMTESQKRAFDHHWSRFGLNSGDGEVNPELLFGRYASLAVEIGFGMGESLLTMAKQEPEINFIGIEVHTPGVGRLMNQLSERAINNVRLYQEDAIGVLNSCFAQESIARLQLYFPDPWHKKKHHKRRIVQADFVQLVWEKLEPKGVFHMATDWQPYAEHMLDVMNGQKHRFSNQGKDNSYSPRPDYRPLTKFEQRGQRLGHGVWDLIFIKS